MPTSDFQQPLFKLLVALLTQLFFNFRSNKVVIRLKVERETLTILRDLVVHNGHEIIGGVVELRTHQTEVLSKVLFGLLGSALVNESAFHQKQQTVEKGVDLGVGLMDGHNYGLALSARQLFEVLHNDEGSERVQPRSGLIEDQHRGIAEEFEGDGSALLLASRDAFQERSSHKHIDALLELQLFDQRLDSFLLFLTADTQLQLGCELEGFHHSQGLEKDVFLHYIVGEIPEALVIIWLTIDSFFPLDLSRTDSACY